MWVVIRHDELGQAVVHTDALDIHRARGWVRVSEPVSDKDSLQPQEYAGASDLDAEPEPEPRKTTAEPRKTTVKKANTETEEK